MIWDCYSTQQWSNTSCHYSRQLFAAQSSAVQSYRWYSGSTGIWSTRRKYCLYLPHWIALCIWRYRSTWYCHPYWLEPTCLRRIEKFLRLTSVRPIYLWCHRKRETRSGSSSTEGNFRLRPTLALFWYWTSRCHLHRSRKRYWLSTSKRASRSRL